MLNTQKQTHLCLLHSKVQWIISLLNKSVVLVVVIIITDIVFEIPACYSHRKHLSKIDFRPKSIIWIWIYRLNQFLFLFLSIVRSIKKCWSGLFIEILLLKRHWLFTKRLNDGDWFSHVFALAPEKKMADQENSCCYSGKNFLLIIQQHKKRHNCNDNNKKQQFNNSNDNNTTNINAITTPNNNNYRLNSSTSF